MPRKLTVMTAYAARPSRQALVDLQALQTRSPGHSLRNSERHLRHCRSFDT